MIESFLVTLDAFPTKEVLSAVGPDEFNNVIGYAIATLTTFDCFVFRHLSLLRVADFNHNLASLQRFQNAAI